MRVRFRRSGGTCRFQAVPVGCCRIVIAVPTPRLFEPINGLTGGSQLRGRPARQGPEHRSGSRHTRHGGCSAGRDVPSPTGRPRRALRALSPGSLRLPARGPPGGGAAGTTCVEAPLGGGAVVALNGSSPAPYLDAHCCSRERGGRRAECGSFAAGPGRVSDLLTRIFAGTGENSIRHATRSRAPHLA